MTALFCAAILVALQLPGRSIIVALQEKDSAQDLVRKAGQDDLHAKASQNLTEKFRMNNSLPSSLRVSGQVWTNASRTNRALMDSVRHQRRACDLTSSVRSSESCPNNIAPINWSDVARTHETHKGCSGAQGTLRTTLGSIPMCTWPSDEDVFISSAILSGGLWDADLVDLMVETLSNSNKPGLVIDAGVNIGQFALIAAGAGHSVIGFEPLPPNVAKVRESVELNTHIAERFLLFEAGLAEACSVIKAGGSKELMAGNNKGGISVSAESAHGSCEVGCDRIPLVQFDFAWQASLKLRPELDALPVHFMKIDIEGNEGLFIKGATKFISDKRPRNIVMELSPQGWSSRACSIVDTLKWLVSLGYTLHRVYQGLTPVADIDQWFRTMMNLNTVDVLLRKST